MRSWVYWGSLSGLVVVFKTMDWGWWSGLITWLAVTWLLDRYWPTDKT